MTDLTAAYTALQKADAAGDAAGAKQLADYIRAQSSAHRAAPPVPSPTQGGDTLQFGPFDTGIHTPEVVDNALSGAGKYFSDVGTGVHELYARAADAVNPQSPTLGSLITGEPAARLAQIRQQITNARERDAPLMASTAGKVGNIGAGVISTLPALAIPGANTVTGAALLGGAQGALQPSLTTHEGMLNTGIGAAAGGIGQAVGNAVTKGAQNILASRTANAAATESQNSVRDAVLQEGRQAGYVVPPSEVNSGATATALESISGKAATKQASQAVNQKVTNSLVAQDLGLAKDQPLTQSILADVREKAGQVYARIKQAGSITTDSAYLDDLAKISNVPEEVAKDFPGATAPAAKEINDLVDSLAQDKFSAANAVEYSKRLRQQATANFAEAGVSKSADTKALAQAQAKGADALEEMVGRHLADNGQAELAPAWDQARTTIAKAYQAEAALKGGNVSATKLAAQLQKGKPMSNGFGLVARFADHFGDATKLPKGGVGVSKLAAVVGGSGVLYGAATLNPAIIGAALAGSVAPYAVRRGLLSGAGQALLASPNYAPNALGTLALQGLQQSSRVALPASTQIARLATQPGE